MSDEPRWVARQKRMFTRVANAYMRLEGLEIGDIYTDLKDGVNLIRFLEILSSSKLGKYTKTPKMDIHRQENLKVVFTFLKANDVPLMNIGAEDIFKGNPKIILAFFWAVIQFYLIRTIALEGVSGKEGLLLWSQRMTAGYDGVDITDFGRSWQSGTGMMALFHKTCPHCIDWEGFNAAQNPEATCTAAFEVGEERYAVPALLEAEDLCCDEKPDEKMVMIYLAFSFKAIARYNRVQQAAGAISQAIDVTKRHDADMAEYESGTAGLLEWIEATIATYTNLDEGRDGHGDTSELIKGALDGFVQYRSETKPVCKSQLQTLLGLLKRLHQSCRNNNRPAYTPPATQTAAIMAQRWEALDAQEQLYEASVESSWTKFRYIETVIAQCEAKVNSSTEWLERTTADVFKSGNYGATAAETSALLDTYTLCAKEIALREEGLATLAEWHATDGFALHARCGEQVAAKDALAALFAEARTSEAEYKRLLDLSAVEHVKAEELRDVSSWIAEQHRDFADFATGTLIEVDRMLAAHESGYLANLQGWKAKMDSVEPNAEVAQAGVAELLASVTAEWAAMEAQGEASQQAGVARQAELRRLIALMHQYNDLATELSHGTDEVAEQLSVPMFADSVAAAEALLADHQATKAPSVASLETKLAVIEPMAAELEAVEEEDISGAFERFVPAELRASVEANAAACAEREADISAPEAGLIYMETTREELRVQFAELAAGVKTTFAGLSERLQAAEADKTSPFEDQLRDLQAIQADADAAAGESGLGPVDELAASLAEWSVTHNSHTDATPTTLRLELDSIVERVALRTAAVEELIELVRQQAEKAAEYDAAAAELLEWIQAQTQTLSNLEEGAAGFGNTAAAVKSAIDAYHAYVNGDKPTRGRDLNKCTAALSKLHAEQAKISQPLYAPPTAVADLESAWGTLGAQETAYDNASAASHVRFQQFEATLVLIDAKVARSIAWLQTQDATFTSGRYGDSLSNVGAILASHAIFSKQFERVTTLPAELNGWLEADSIHLHGEHKTAAAKVEQQLQQQIAQTEQLAASYKSALDMSLAEFEKLEQLVMPERWMDGVVAFIAERQAAKPTNLGEVDHELKRFDIAYAQKLPSMQTAIDAVRESTADKAGQMRKSVVSCMSKLTALEMKLANTMASAEEWIGALDTQRAEIVEAIGQVTLFNQVTAEYDVMVGSLEEELSVPISADSIEAVDAAIKTFDEQHRPKMNEIIEKYAEVSKSADWLEACPAEEAKHAFSRYLPDTLYDKLLKANEKADAREMELKDEETGLWVLERYRDDLRKQFAAAAEELQNYCEDKPDEMSRMSMQLEAQIETCKEFIAEYKESTLLEAARTLSASCNEYEIIVNSHTKHNIFTLEAAWTSLSDHYTETEGDLARALMIQQGREVTPEQLAELRETFDFFDADDSGELDQAELHSCLTSTGMVLSEEELQVHFNEIDTDGSGAIGFDEFFPFMVARLEKPASTLADVAAEFQLLNDPRRPPLEFVSTACINKSFEEFVEAAAYLLENMKPMAPEPLEDIPAGVLTAEAPHYETAPYVAELFSR